MSTGRPDTRADSSSITIANSARPGSPMLTTITVPSADDEPDVVRRDRQDRSEEVGEHVDAAALGGRALAITAPAAMPP